MDKMKAANAQWTFETVCSTYPVKFFMNGDQLVPNGWYYEVTVLSSGCMQLGWTKDITVVEPMKGFGVGDDESSYAFDGRRCRTWNGFWRFVTGSSTCHRFHGLNGEPYGRNWEAGDVISCLLFRSGKIHFWLNGRDLGRAFSGLSGLEDGQLWYPAGSLSLDQSCRFNFGGVSPFRYRPPPGFWPVGDVLNYDDRVGNESLDAHREAVANRERCRRVAVSHTPLPSPDPFSEEDSSTITTPQVHDCRFISQKQAPTGNELYFSFRVTSLMVMQCKVMKFGWTHCCLKGKFEVAAYIRDDGYLHHPCGEKFLLAGDNDGQWIVFTSAMSLLEKTVTFLIDGKVAGSSCQLPSQVKAFALSPMIVGSRFSLNGCGDWPGSSAIDNASRKKKLSNILRKFACHG